MRGSTPTLTVIGRTVRAVAAVDARLAVQDALAHDVALELEELVVDLLRRSTWATRRRLSVAMRLRLDLGEARVALLLLGDAVGLAESGLRVQAQPRCASSAFGRGGCQFQRGLPASAASSRMARMAICICSWPKTTAPSITSSDRPLASDSTISTAVLGAGDDQVQLRFGELGWRSGLSRYWPSL